MASSHKPPSTPPTFDALAWLAAVREQIGDAISAANDATRRPRARVLSRAEARRKVRAADRALDALLARGEAHLRRPEGTS